MPGTIVSVESSVIRVPCHRSIKGHNRSVDSQVSLMVCVRNRDGDEGWGEADPSLLPGTSSARELKEIVDGVMTPAVLGTELGNFSLLHKRMDAAISGYYGARRLWKWLLMTCSERSRESPSGSC